jgi:hypothetical protein
MEGGSNRTLRRLHGRLRGWIFPLTPSKEERKQRNSHLHTRARRSRRRSATVCFGSEAISICGAVPRHVPHHSVPSHGSSGFPRSCAWSETRVVRCSILYCPFLRDTPFSPFSRPTIERCKQKTHVQQVFDDLQQACRRLAFRYKRIHGFQRTLR